MDPDLDGTARRQTLRGKLGKDPIAPLLAITFSSFSSRLRSAAGRLVSCLTRCRSSISVWKKSCVRRSMVTSPRRVSG